MLSRTPIKRLRSSSTRCLRNSSSSNNQEQPQQQQQPQQQGLSKAAQLYCRSLAGTTNFRWLSSSSSSSSLPETSTTPILPSSTDQLLAENNVCKDLLHTLAQQEPTPLRLIDMYKFGSSSQPQQRILNAQFLYQELPVRIAHRVVDLLTLPDGLSEAQPIRQVASIYLKFLQRFQEFPPISDSSSEERFTDMLQTFILDRKSVPISIAQGVHVWCRNQRPTPEMEAALYRFFTARVGLRFLTEHYCLTSNRDSSKSLRNITSLFPVTDSTGGCIDAQCDIIKEIKRVADLVTLQTKDHYGVVSPVIDIVDCDNSDGTTTSSSPNNFCYVPHHLHYVLAELLKNSCRAHLHQKSTDPIRVIVVKGDEDVTIKIADRGGGIPRSLIDTIWKFAHSTKPAEEKSSDFGADGLCGAPIRGFGLPLARIYARYFGGELTLKSMEGYGVDSYLHLPRLGTACEHLPLKVLNSPAGRDSTPRQ